MGKKKDKGQKMSLAEFTNDKETSSDPYDVMASLPTAPLGADAYENGGRNPDLRGRGGPGGGGNRDFNQGDPRRGPGGMGGGDRRPMMRGGDGGTRNHYKDKDGGDRLDHDDLYEEERELDWGARKGPLPPKSGGFGGDDRGGGPAGGEREIDWANARKGPLPPKHASSPDGSGGSRPPGQELDWGAARSAQPPAREPRTTNTRAGDQEIDWSKRQGPLPPVQPQQQRKDFDGQENWVRKGPPAPTSAAATHPATDTNNNTAQQPPTTTPVATQPPRDITWERKGPLPTTNHVNANNTEPAAGEQENSTDNNNSGEQPPANDWQRKGPPPRKYGNHQHQHQQPQTAAGAAQGQGQGTAWKRKGPVHSPNNEKASTTDSDPMKTAATTMGAKRSDDKNRDWNNVRKGSQNMSKNYRNNKNDQANSSKSTTGTIDTTTITAAKATTNDQLANTQDDEWTTVRKTKINPQRAS